MEGCSICFSKFSEKIDHNKSKKTLLCCHSLCFSCYIRLDKTQCPFCRTNFNYTDKELITRNKLDINYSNWQPPSQITNYIPINIIHSQDNDNGDFLDRDIPFSRVRRNMRRKRRKDLTFQQVLERRNKIKKRCKMKWNKKNGRFKKELSDIPF